jgi:hypothetical protein
MTSFEAPKALAVPDEYLAAVLAGGNEASIIA